MKYFIQWQDQFGKWQKFTTKVNERDAYRTAAARAKSTGLRHRLITETKQLVDLIDP